MCVFGRLVVELFVELFQGLILDLKLIVVIDKFRVLQVVVDVVLMLGMRQKNIWMKIWGETGSRDNILLGILEYVMILMDLRIR